MATVPIVVMFVIGSMGDARAGTERSVLTLAAKLDRSRFAPILVSLQDCEFIRSAPHPCEVHCLNVSKVYSPAFFRGRRALIKLMQQRHVAIIQSFFTEAHLLAGQAARTAGVPVIISSRRNLGYNYNLKESLFLRLANHHPTRFLANSEAVADAIAAAEHLDRSRIDVIYNGIALTPRPPASTSGRPTIVMIANLRPVKSVDMLLRAVPRISARFPDLLVRIIGDGPDRRQLEALIDRLQINNHAQLLGSLPDVGPAITGAHVGVLTSLSEGFSNAILEYMHAGLPVVATSVGGNREIVADGDNGYLVPVGDPRSLAERLIHLLSNPELARSLGDNGRALIAKKFSLKTMVGHHQAYYLRLLEAHRGKT